MTEQPSGGGEEAPAVTDDAAQTAPDATEHEHVRTEGETTVDDALGGADDPR